MSAVLFQKEIKSNGKLWGIFALVLAMYASVIVAMFDPKLGESLNMMTQSMPEVFAIFGMLDVGSTMVEFVANYLYGFLLIGFPLVFIVLLSMRLVARYVDRGSMAYLLATPNKRRRLALTQAVVLLLGIFLLVGFVTVLCLIVSGAMFPGELDAGAFLALNTGLFCLLVLLGGVCFFSSCLFSDTRNAGGLGAGLTIGFILLQMLSRVGDKFDWLKYLTPLTLYDTSGLIAGDSTAWLWSILLLVFGLLLFGAGILVFCRRDLPV